MSRKKQKFGTDPTFLHRRDAGQTSVEAALKVDSAGLEKRVFDVVCKAGCDGITQDRIMEALPDVSYPSITARFSALLRKGLIEDTGNKLPGRSGRMQRVIRPAGVCEVKT